MLSISKQTLSVISAAAAAFAIGNATAAIAEPTVKSVVQTTPDIGSLERRFFSRVYDKDATDKRIQRLELLLFGATQDGGMVERLDRIQQSIADRAKAPKSAPAQGADSATIAALERKILKKSFDSETPMQRLARLESKVFGQASPSMSIGDRVFRLKKILNVETPSISGIPKGPEIGSMGGMRSGLPHGLGKMRSGIPRGMDGLRSGIPHGMEGFGGMNGMGGGMNGLDNDLLSPFGSFSYAPFANGHGDEMAQQMNEMIKQLNKSLRGLHKLPDGAPNVSPFGGPGASPFGQGTSPFGSGTSPFGGGASPFSGPGGSAPLSPSDVSPFIGPNGTPFVQPFRARPQQSHDTELPPYLDPNSI